MPELPRETDAELTELLAFAGELADSAASVTLAHFRISAQADNKAPGGLYDPVTAADRDAEAAIRARIARRFPDHGILGEEHGEERGTASRVWVIDPIDGTRSFIAGIPLWGTLIALRERGVPLLGLMDQPYLGERYIGTGKGAWQERRGRRTALRTRGSAELECAVLMCTDPAMFTPGLEADVFDALRARARLVRYGADCYAYCMLASGLVDLVVESGLKPYDIQALIPIIRGAGGIVTDWRGGPAYDGGQVIAAGSAQAHAAALAILASAAH